MGELQIARKNNMKLGLNLILAIALLAAFTSKVAAQSTTGIAQRAEDLRSQLLDIQAKEAELQARERQLNEALKPENIERSLAGIGSTRPEELREQRRRQLTIERDGVQAQLKLMQTRRERLESALRTADGMAYQQSAEGTSPPPPPLSQMLTAQHAASPRWLVRMVAGLIGILALGFVIVVIRRRSTMLDLKKR